MNFIRKYIYSILKDIVNEEIEDIKINLKPKINIISLCKDKDRLKDIDALIRFITNVKDIDITISTEIVTPILTYRDVNINNLTLNYFMDKELQELITDKLEYITNIFLHVKGYYNNKCEHICVLVRNNRNEPINIEQANLLIKQYKDAINTLIPEQLL